MFAAPVVGGVCVRSGHSKTGQTHNKPGRRSKHTHRERDRESENDRKRRKGR